MRLMIIYHSGGVSACQGLYDALARRRDVRLTLVLPERIRVDPIYAHSGYIEGAAQLDCSRFRAIPVPLRDPTNYASGFRCWALAQAIRAARPDVIHVLDEANSAGLWQTTWLTRVYRPAASVFFYAFQNLPLFGWRAPWKWRIAWRLVAGGAGASNEALDRIRAAGFPPGRPLARIFWAVPLEIFRPMPAEPLRKRLGLLGKRVVGFVGRLVPEKGLATLLAALLQLPRDVHALIIGQGPIRSDLALWSALPALEGRVHHLLPMPQAELARHINCMDVLVLPSLTTPTWKEQYGRVLLEAMACGVPVVGSSSGAIPEVLGQAGLVCPESDPGSLAAAIGRILEDRSLSDRLRQEGRARVEREASAEAMAAGFMDLYAQAGRVAS